MRFSTVAAALLPVGAAVAQTTWPVSVGGPALASGALNLTYTPDQLLQVAPGDTILFTFEAGNHSVTQSNFTNPCTPLAGGFNSGFQDAANATQTVNYTVPANTTGPLWFYCAQTTPAVHCQKGMVFAINPTANKTFDTFQQTAMATNGTNSTSSGSNSTGTSSGSAANPSSTSPSGTSSGAPAATSSNAAMLTGAGTAGALLSGLGFLAAALF